MAAAFDYEQAFSRNIGWLTRAEQQALRRKRVAIAGMGGVGGVHLLTLARLGIGAFHIADFDTFDIANFNRQVGAGVSTLEQAKVDVLAAMARDVNPELDIRVFPDGVNDANLGEFFDGVDLYVDGLDFFAFDARQATFAACARLGIPACTAAPLGIGAAWLNFMPGGMTFDEYFGWGDRPDAEKALRFMLGLAPAGLHRRYLVDPSAVDFAGRRGPSTVMACQLCAGVAAAEAMKILLRRGPVLAAPRGAHFDAYRNKFVRTWRPGGHRHPLQRVALAVGRRVFAAAMNDSASRSTNERPALPGRIGEILELARWAPSGDNTQPWRFEVVDESNLVVHGFDTRAHCVYDLDGHPSQVSIGAMLETMRIAASAHGLRMDARRRPESDEAHPTIDVRFAPDAAVRADPLLSFVTTRSVQRRPMKTRALTPGEKQALEAAVGPGYQVRWLEGVSARLRTARLLFDNAKLRLTMPEAYEVHRSIIEWRARFSADRVPDQALGIDPVTVRLMRFVMKSWGRVRFFNRFLAGTWMPRIQMDLVPGIACAAHFVIEAQRPPETIDDYIEAGRVVQRFWLTVTQLGLVMQPEMTPLIFSRYAREGRRFSALAGLREQASRLAGRLAELIGHDAVPRAAFMGRVGQGEPAVSRSVRRAVSELLVVANPGAEGEPAAAATAR